MKLKFDNQNILGWILSNLFQIHIFITKSRYIDFRLFIYNCSCRPIFTKKTNTQKRNL